MKLPTKHGLRRITQFTSMHAMDNNCRPKAKKLTFMKMDNNSCIQGALGIYIYIHTQKK